MKRLAYLACIVTLTCLAGSAMCQAPTVRPSKAVKVAETDHLLATPDAALAAKLRAPISKQVLMNTLMSDPKTKSVLMQEGSKLGFSETQLQRVTSVRLPAPGTFDPPVDQVEVAYRALDWHSGFDFAINSIPTYPPGSARKLGVIRLYPCRVNSTPTTYVCMNPGNTAQHHAAMLDVELPTEPALYAVTIKISRWYAPCYPNWLNPKPGSSATPIAARFMERRSGTEASQVPITLTALPDGYGYVGIISASPNGTLMHGGHFGMRKSTARVILALHPSATRPGEGMGDLMFRGFTITRL